MQGGAPVSQTDSFIDEVNEEVRRDRLYSYLRRFGWIGILLVVLVVGGAALFEYGNNKRENVAQAFGDEVLAALDADTPEARIAALQQVATDQESQQAVINMLIAGEAANMADGQALAQDSLAAVRSGKTVGTIYPDVATFKKALFGDGNISPAERRTTLTALDVPGNPMRLLAEEQIALTYIEEGNTDQAIAMLQEILADAETTQDLHQRASQLIVALGGTPDAAG